MKKFRNPVGLRYPRNNSEALCFDRLHKDGWEITKRGWPDFACFRGEEMAFVEVKPSKRARLTKMQFRIMMALIKRGITCFLWTPEKGFELVNENTPHIT